MIPVWDTRHSCIALQMSKICDDFVFAIYDFMSFKTDRTNDRVLQMIVPLYPNSQSLEAEMSLSILFIPYNVSRKLLNSQLVSYLHNICMRHLLTVGIKRIITGVKLFVLMWWNTDENEDDKEDISFVILVALLNCYKRSK